MVLLRACEGCSAVISFHNMLACLSKLIVTLLVSWHAALLNNFAEKSRGRPYLQGVRSSVQYPPMASKLA